MLTLKNKANKTSIENLAVSLAMLLLSTLSLLVLSSTLAVAANSMSGTANKTDERFSQGYELIRSQQYQAAERYWRGIYQSSLGKPTQQAIALQQVAKAQWATQRLKVAMNSLKLAIKKLDRDSDAPLLGSLYYQLAIIEIPLGSLEEAQTHLQQSMRLVGSGKDILTSSLIKNRIGQVFALQDKHKQALKYFTESFEAFLSIDDLQGAMIAARNAIKSAITQQSYALAIDLFSQALNFVGTESTARTSTTVPSLTAVQSLTTAKIALIDVLDKFPKSQFQVLRIKYLHAVLLLKNIAEASDSHEYNVSYALAVLAGLYFRVGETEQALRISNKALLYSQALGPNKLLVRSLVLSGDIYRLQGDKDRAIQAYRLAVKDYRSQQGQDSAATVSFSTAQNVDDIVIDAESLYLALADLLLAKARTEKDALTNQLLLVEARNAIELKKVTELQNYFQNSCDVSRAASKMEIDKIIQAGSAAIYPIILPDRMEILVTFDTGILQFQVKKDSVSIRQTVNQLRANLENLNSRAYLIDAKKIYDWVIAPLEAEFTKRDIKTLVIISEDTLRTIPFSVLYDGRQYLVEKYALAVAPSLELTAPASLDRKKIRILLSGISDAVQGYPPLPYVRGELEEIQDLYTTKLLLNREFVTKNFEMELRGEEYNIAHLASHSEFKGSVKDSFILTFDGKMSMEQLSDITSLVPGQKRPIDLLTLSACQTAVGDDKAALGLAGVAVKAGARSALATLWSIDDYASSVLVSEFYKELLDAENSKAQALRKAQLKLIRSGRFDHPAYWSPFLMIGNWL